MKNVFLKVDSIPEAETLIALLKKLTLNYDAQTNQLPTFAQDGGGLLQTSAQTPTVMIFKIAESDFLYNQVVLSKYEFIDIQSAQGQTHSKLADYFDKPFFVKNNITGHAEYVLHCIVSSYKNIFNFKGRTSPYEIWSLSFFLIPPGLLAEIQMKYTGQEILVQWDSSKIIILNLLYLLVHLPLISAIVRRLQDTSKSGWNILGLIVPVINLYFVYIVWLKKSDSFENKYGPPPQF